MTAAVGYSELTPDMLTVAEADLRAALERLPEGLPGLVRAGQGCRWPSAGPCGRQGGS
ncbi:hypothetical protein [Streptomyces sp. TLI_185]|uniref:hypothetical protein n=1 Tax=Streptomyces sp. TLI_185 TaxID=2485151 RepID=UPI001619CAD5|nr:hypothetical protein [Streptomyces sp. TLI_185]